MAATKLTIVPGIRAVFVAITLMLAMVPLVFGMVPTLVMTIVVTVVVASFVVTIVRVVIRMSSIVTVVMVQRIDDQVGNRSTSQHFDDVVSVMVRTGSQRRHQ